MRRLRGGNWGDAWYSISPWPLPRFGGGITDVQPAAPAAARRQRTDNQQGGRLAGLRQRRRKPPSPSACPLMSRKPRHCPRIRMRTFASLATSVRSAHASRGRPEHPPTVRGTLTRRLCFAALGSRGLISTQPRRSRPASGAAEQLRQSLRSPGPPRSTGRSLITLQRRTATVPRCPWPVSTARARLVQSAARSAGSPVCEEAPRWLSRSHLLHVDHGPGPWRCTPWVALATSFGIAVSPYKVLMNVHHLRA